MEFLEDCALLLDLDHVQAFHAFRETPECANRSQGFTLTMLTQVCTQRAAPRLAHTHTPLTLPYY